MYPFRSSALKSSIFNGFAFIVAACWVFYPSIWWCIGSFLAFQFYWCVGLSACNHRYYSHRAFKTSRFWEEVMLFASAACISGHPGLYAMVHNRHHSISDQPDDPHHIFARLSIFSPRDMPLKMTPSEKRHYLLDPVMNRMFNYYYLYPLATILVLSLISFEALIYLWAIPVAVNSFARKYVTVIWMHGYGYQSYDTGDKSTNSKLLGWLFGGEGLHNNHHRFPGRWNFAVRRDEFDPTSLFIRMIKK